MNKTNSATSSPLMVAPFGRIGARALLMLALLILSPTCALTQTDNEKKPIIEAHGHGEAHVKADQAIISLAIETRGDTADEAVKANTAKVATIIQALKSSSQSGKSENIETASLSISPDYSNQGQVPNKTRSYSAGRRIDVNVPSEDLALAGEVGTLATMDANARLGGTDSESMPGKIRVIIDYSSSAPTLDEAVRTMTQGAQKLQRSIEAKLGGHGTIKTEDSFGEGTAPDNSRHTGPNGYVAQSTMTVKLDQVDQVGSVTDSAIKAGASRLNSVSFGIANANNLQGEAIAAATRNAESKAQAQASALNLKLGRLLKSTTAPLSFSMPLAQPESIGSLRASIRLVNPGQVTNSAEVILTYATQ